MERAVPRGRMARREGLSKMTQAAWRGQNKRLWRRVMPISLLAVMAVLLSACVEVNQQSTIKADYTGTSQIRIGISRQALLLFGGLASSFGTPSASSARSTRSDPIGLKSSWETTTVPRAEVT